MDFNHDGGIDLHIHTTASDGTYTPAEILQMAAESGLRAIAITDHDTLDGARLVAQCNTPESLVFLPGVEISTQAPSQCPVRGSLHILGYGIDVNHQPLQAALHNLQQARNTRISKIVNRLNQLGIDIHLADVKAEVGEGAAGRPHVAGVLIKKGVVNSIDEAFDRYLGKNRPAYVDKERLDCGQAFALIKNAGGVPVLAHPSLVKKDLQVDPGVSPEDGLENLVDILCQMGLMGIEVYYPQHPPEIVAAFLEMARSRGLLVTGGTDFHGEVTPEIQLGKGHGEMHVPFVLYENLAAAIGRPVHKCG